MADLPVERLKKRCLEFNVLEKMNNDLCNALPIDDLFPSMISNHVIDFTEKKDICAERTERRRIQYFLERYLSKGLDLEVPDTTRFYRFLEVMKRSSKCNFLVKRINQWMERYKEYSAKPGQSDKSSLVSTPPTTTTTAPTKVTTGHVTTTPVCVTTTPGHVTTTSVYVTTAPGHVTTTAGYVATSPCCSPGTVIIGGNDCLVGGRDSKKCMRLMQRYIIPKISDEWEAVATFLDYTIVEKNNIRDTYNREPMVCCRALLEDWLSSDHGVKPKTWKNLLKAIEEVEELQPVLHEIKEGLQSGGVTFEMFPVEESYDYNTVGDDEEQVSRAAPNIQYQPQPPYHYQAPYTEDPTGQGWNVQPQSSINEQFGLYGRPSYDMPSTAVEQHRRLMATTHPTPAPNNRQPYATGMEQYGGVPANANHTNQQPHGFSAFILYSKENHDPDGDQVLCLSNLLNNIGINCDIDLYHLTENIIDWSFWVGKRVEYYSTSMYSYVILVCSPTMIATLEERSDNACVEMVGASIDRLTLRYYLQQGAQRVLPLFINKSSADYVPPSLSGKTSYHFPYDILADLPPEILPQEVLNHPSFTSLRSLVATLTGQPEHVPPGRSQQPHAQRPDILRHDHNQPPSTLDQNSPYENATAPPGFTTRTGEQGQHDIPHGEQLQPLLPGATGVQSGQVRVQPHGPAARNNPNILRRDPDMPPSFVDQDRAFENTTAVPQNFTARTAEQATLRTGEQATLRTGEQATPRTGEQDQHDIPHGEQLHHHQPLLPGAAGVQSVRTQPQRSSARNSPKCLRHDPEQPLSAVDQQVHLTGPQSVTPRTAEQVTPRTGEQDQHDILHGEQVHHHQPPLPGAAGVQSGQWSLISLYPQSVQLRTMEKLQAQDDMSLVEQVVGHHQPLISGDVHSRQATSLLSSVATVQAEEETGGVKRQREYSSSDNESYTTPNASPGDGSQGTMNGSHYPTQAEPSMTGSTTGQAETTTCTEQNNSSYHPVFAGKTET